MYKTIQHLIIVCATLGSFSAIASENMKPEFAWIPEVGAASSFQAQLGAGLLDNKGITGSRGTPIYVLFKANYSPNDETGLVFDLPLAGTLSGGPDDFGVGNITVGGNHRLFQTGNTSFSFGANFTFPTSNNGSRVGAFTRNYVSFVPDQYAISPYVNAVFSNEKYLMSFDVGSNEQIFSPTPAGLDKVESILFYDAGFSMAINNPRDFWVVLEFGGFTSLTYPNNDTFLFGGPGVRYQDEEKSYGIHLQVPFSNPNNDQIDLMVMTDIRFKF